MLTALSPSMLQTILDEHPDPMTLHLPVFGENGSTVVDFTLAYCNKTQRQQANLPVDDMIGQKVSELYGYSPEGRQLLLRQLLDVYVSGRELDSTYYNEVLDVFFNVNRRKVSDGVLTVAKNVTAQVKEQLEKENQQHLVDLILRTSLNGWFICEAVLDDDQQVVDFIITRINPRFSRLSGLTEEQVIGQRYLHLFPATAEQGAFELNCRVFKTGNTEKHRMHYEGNNMNAWYDVAASKLDERSIIVTFADVTEHVHALEEVQQKSHLVNSILAHSPVGIAYGKVIRNKDGHIIDGQTILANDAAISFSGIPRELFLTKTAVELEPNIVDSPYFQKILHTMHTGEPTQVEYHVEHSDKWIEISIGRMDSDHLIIVYADITDRKRTLAEIEQKTALLDNILLYSANGISVTSVIRNAAGAVIDGRTILANDAAVAYTGLPREVYLTKTATELEPNILQSPFFQLCLRTLETGEPAFVQYQLESTGRWLEVSVSRMDSEHLITIFTDITSSKEANLQQQRLVTDLRRSNAALEEFTRAASHDLKEPIRKVHFFTDKLKNQLGDRLNEEEAGILRKVETATERMRLLVDDLLEYSHLNENPAEKETIDLNEKMTMILSDIELLVQDKRAVIEIDPLPVVQGYRRQLQQLFQNLLANALKYSKPGVPPYILVKAKERFGRDVGFSLPPHAAARLFYCIEICDNGIGFHQDDADRIFNVFTRLHGNKEYPGTGIGLSIVKRVVENHEGFIYARGEQGNGACFTVLLPAPG